MRQPSQLRSVGPRHIISRDDRMARVIRAVGPCLLPKRPSRYAALVGAIISQQVSVHAARAVQGRLRQAAGGYLSAARIDKLSPARIRAAGLSAAKSAYVAGLTENVISGRLRLDDIHRLDDEAVIERLVAVKGIGRWTAEMFLMFVLNRPDVMPTGDLGIKNGFKKVYRLRALPSEKKMLALSQPWRPYRTIGSWYLWRSLSVDKIPAA